MMTMHSRTRELLEHLQQSRAALRAAVDAVPAALREKEPAPDRWSIAQVLEHLLQVESGITVMLNRGLRQLQREGLKPASDDSPVLPTIDRDRLLDREKKLTAPESAQPKKQLTCDQALQALADSRGGLEEALRAGDGCDVDGVHWAHPFLGDLRFHQWVAFVGFHEQRHADQVAATGKQLQG
jgi:uncharacterized damage-inducible protein DinB